MSLSPLNQSNTIFKTLMVLPMFGLGALLTVSCDYGYSEAPISKNQPVTVARGWPKIGTSSPSFKLAGLDGNHVSLSDFHGKVVLLNFWATWCGPCRVEMPAMEVLYRDLHVEGLEILAVSVDPQGMAVTRPFQEAMGLTFPILHDSDYRVGSAYGARTLPMTYLIDRKGFIRHRIFGARDWSGPEAQDIIRSLLDGTSS